mmetsp:Transcript_69830/g.204386  ORF Transcript_69830/g.204386 Transcript_69830/m.204386 type:complete len:348 (-) Transcript_69830:102-1145(-)
MVLGFFASARLMPGKQAALAKFPPLPRLTPIPELAEAEMEERKGLEPERQQWHGDSRMVVFLALGMMLVLGLASALALVTDDAATPAIVPQAHGHGGAAACEGNEELFHGLCYKKCSLLTGGLDSIRTSPWTCCDSHPCGFNQRADIGSHVACAGYDVAGDGSCPHRPGACLEDEELFLGVCYKKCSLLTDEEYPNRVGPATCCKDSGLGCLDPRKDYTSKEFAVGGSNKDTASAEANACGEEGELLLGACYKKCSLLTGNEYPHRVAAATCCKADSRLPHKDGDGTWSLGCLDFRNDKTSSKFNVRVSGHGDKAHLPLKNLTEARGTHLPLQNLTEAASSVYPTHQ